MAWLVALQGLPSHHFPPVSREAPLMVRFTGFYAVLAMPREPYLMSLPQKAFRVLIASFHSYNCKLETIILCSRQAASDKALEPTLLFNVLR